MALLDRSRFDVVVMQVQDTRCYSDTVKILNDRMPKIIVMCSGSEDSVLREEGHISSIFTAHQQTDSLCKHEVLTISLGYNAFAFFRQNKFFKFADHFQNSPLLSSVHIAEIGVDST